MVRKNVLITMGCSFTRGVGSWGVNKKLPTSFDNLNKQIHLEENKKRFDEFGWPKNVGRELGFDKVINISQDGSSNSGQLKHLLELDILNENVYIIWMLTEPTRFSFYKNSKIVDINPTSLSEISKSYLSFIEDIHTDPILEELFYVNCLREICENRNYKLLLTYWNESGKLLQNYDLNKSNYLFKIPYNLIPPKKDMISKICGHPNELGYKWITEKIVNEIKLNHTEFVVGDENNDIFYNHIEYKKNNINRQIL